MYIIHLINSHHGQLIQGGFTMKNIVNVITRRGKKYNWGQIMAYAVILILEKISNNKHFLWKCAWLKLNILVALLLVTLPIFNWDSIVFQGALCCYGALFFAGFIISPVGKKRSNNRDSKVISMKNYNRKSNLSNKRKVG